jgi:NADH-quinone oxidoreductase subunit A
MSPTSIVGYLALFSSVGFLFLFATLLVGRFLRPHAPNAEKLEVYECGEPTIGSSFVQFDLRFYVIALLFIIFDVEIAFFFPWAVVFGKSTHLMDRSFDKVAVVSPEAAAANGTEAGLQLTPQAAQVFNEMGLPQTGIPDPTLGEAANQRIIEESANMLAMVSMMDILVFFVVLLVGFAYVWRRGDLDWVRAVSNERAAGPSLKTPEPELALVS